MNTATTKDGTKIYFKDWGTGQPVVFSHGWPLTADAWDAQMLFLGQNGYRVIAHDRRGHGRSGQPWNGNDMNTYADDLAELIENLDLKNAVLVGHSTGGGEVARYIGRHGSKRVAAKNSRKSRRFTDGCVRQHPRGSARRSFPVFQRSYPAVLRSQSAGREGVARSAGRVLASGDAGVDQGCL